MRNRIKASIENNDIVKSYQIFILQFLTNEYPKEPKYSYSELAIIVYKHFWQFIYKAIRDK